MMERPTPTPTPPEPEAEVDTEAVDVPPPEDAPGPEPAPAKGRGAAPAKGGRTGGVKGKRVRAHTVYLPEDLFERVWIQARRRGKTLSEYVTWALERQAAGPRAGRDAEDAA
jgi:hypothetical protein